MLFSCYNSISYLLGNRMKQVKIYNFDEAKRIRVYFGGISSKKEAIVDNDGNRYMIKYPQSLKTIPNRHSNSYANNSLSEFIGSHLYNFTGIPAHKTFLGMSRNQIAVACQLFTTEDKNFFEFGQTLNSYFPETPEKAQQFGRNSSSDHPLLPGVISILDDYEDFESIRKEIKERFWDMFVIDSIIANPDRNNGNWGIFTDRFGSNIELAPVYDNGNSLNAKWNENTMREVLASSDKEQLQSFSKTACAFSRIKNDGEPHPINPYLFIRSRASEECSKAVLRLQPRLEESIKKTCELIDSIPVISDIQRTYYKTSIRGRYEKLFLPSFILIKEQGLSEQNNKKVLETEVAELGSIQKEKIRRRI